jgi:lysyl-tRNA synthetase, class I
VRYYHDFVKPSKVYRAPTDQERAAMEDLRDRLKAWDGRLDAEALQAWSSPSARSTGSSRCATGSRRSTRCSWGASQGPRFGGFIALYGIEESIALIDAALGGSFASS